MTKQRVSIAIAGIIQILIAVYLFYIFYLKLRLKSTPIINIAISSYIVHLFISSQGVLRMKNAGRILSVTNFLIFLIFSFASMFLVGIDRFPTLLFCLILFFISFYFIYFLTRSKIKQLFKKENKKLKQKA